MASDRRRALDRIAGLARAHDLSVAEIRKRLEESGDADEPSAPASRAMTILAYLGAVFVFSGLVTAVNLVWPALGSPSRVLATLGSGMVALVLSLFAHRDPRFRRASLPLFVIGAVTQTAGLFVVLSEFSTGGSTALGAAAVFATMTLQMLLLFAHLRWTVAAFFALAFGFSFVAAILSWLDVDGTAILFVIGISGLMATIGIARTAHAAIAPAAFPVFAVFIAFSAFDALEGSFPLDCGLIGIAAGLLIAGVRVRSRSLLATGVAVTLGYLGYYTDEYFAGMLGWPIALILVGFAMIALSGYAIRLGRDIESG
ncbi:MAG: DUF2157 domain-containing protein [Candidatus Wenzhouxiangella sp. M2_3B_020]